MSVNYDQIAQTYDRFRSIGGPFMDSILSLARESGARSVVELGAGTGNNSVALLEGHPCQLTCLDASLGMLREGRRKCPSARWIQANALATPLASGVAQFVFSVYMLHHIDDLDPLFRECARLLGSGHSAHVTTTHDFIERHPMNRYFPSFASIDTKRFQPLETVVSAMKAAGFNRIDHRVHRAAPVPIDSAYLRKIENRFISTFNLMDSTEFDEGVARLRSEIELKGHLDEPIAWESMVVWGSI
ncbi:MAG: methyltransferase domain-containing protein [Candidatus Hydrogenedentes bacterium]|nr:methyltransferase domain-containing protein [Candidatus Hydrogenedentota bacterium]